MADFFVGVLRDGADWADVAMFVAGWVGITAGVCLAVVIMPQPIISTLYYLVPPLQRHEETLKSRRLGEAIFSGEMVIAIGSYDPAADLEHWTELNFGERTKTRFTRRPKDPNSVSDVTVEPLDDPRKESSPC